MGVSAEARVMAHLARHGYPVPRVYSADGNALIMERLHGPTMLDEFARHPWLLGRHARTLALLHDQLHDLEGPSWLPHQFGSSRTMLHLDLHPANVIITRRGPVVIDWQKAARGDPAADVALTMILLRTRNIPGSLLNRVVGGAARAEFLRRFVSACGGRPTSYHLAQVAAARLATTKLTPNEAARIRRLLQEEALRSASAKDAR
jgi:aminoglycoside phosphotransferase (APT) family kinase protein